MKTFFGEKLKKSAFLGTLALISATSFLLVGCDKTTEHIDSKTSEQPQKKPVSKNVTTSENLEDTTPDGKRIIYLTFDDGPNRGTENLLKILHKRNVVATAFVVGKHVNGSTKQKKNFAELQKDSLIEIANHSFSHASNHYLDFYKNPEKVVADFDSANAILGLNNKIARTPGRNIWRLNDVNVTDIASSKNAANQLQAAGYKLVGWDLEWRPTPKMSLKGNHQQMMKKVDSIFYNDLEKTSKHLVFLTHDQYLVDDESLAELDAFINVLQQSNRFEFRKISEYPKINEILN
ncbi:polysaccharide deacetylase family protein [Soonwooa sp.]|uniref:polysaccharide deacetylase family protein n=1 Tax=Soonwooa sp. TaxID=1938592 RepID=UPI00261726BC|nr:polysaccharide deacetylase family protein [Soonwooa sp.]